MDRLVSVVVPVYNSEKFLARCVSSILKQSYSELELLLIDDGSTDLSGKICDEFAALDNRVRVFHKNNEGVSVARNVGIEMSRGAYISFVDSDDWIEIDFLKEMVSSAIEHNSNIVVGGYRTVWNYKTKCHRLKTANIITNLKYIIQGDFFVWQNLYKANFICKYKFCSNISYGEDYIFLVDVFTDTKAVSFVPCQLYNYSQENTESAMHKNLLLNFFQQKTASDIAKNILERKGICSENKEYLNYRYCFVARNLSINAIREFKNNSFSLKRILKYGIEAHRLIPNILFYLLSKFL